MTTPPKQKGVGLWPATIIRSRYSGVYSGAKWLALNVGQHSVPGWIHGDDVTCVEGFSENSIRMEEKDYSAPYGLPIGRGDTPTDALHDLRWRLQEKHPDWDAMDWERRERERRETLP